MSAIEEWLMLLLLEGNVKMLRAEAEMKARVLALLVLMQKDIVSLLANADEMSTMSRAGKAAVLREANAMIADYYAQAQAMVDLPAVAQVEAMVVRNALAAVVDGRLAAALPAKGAAREAVIAEFRRAAERQAAHAPIKAEAARVAAIKDALKAGLDEAAATAAGKTAAARSLEVSQNATLKITDATKSTSIQIRMGAGLPTEGYLAKLAGDTLIQGSPAKNWWLRQQLDTQFKVANQIRIGAAQGETNAQIIKRIVGEEATVKPVVSAPTAKAPTPEVSPGQPGVMPLAKKNAAAVVQTSMAAVSAAARRATLELNKDVTNGFMQVSTLDSHTSLTCIAYSGACWNWEYEPINGNDLPWNGGVPRHWNCRSAEVAIMKTLREMGIDMDDPDPGQRASAAGPIGAKTTFADFLKAMGPLYQDETLGKGRAELFRAGKLTSRQLVDMSGRPLKLETLKAELLN